MGWAYCGKDDSGREIGYGIEAVCDEPMCGKEIDRGLSYACGSMHGGGDEGCGKYFCAKHLYLGRKEQLCKSCFDAAMSSHTKEEPKNKQY